MSEFTHEVAKPGNLPLAISIAGYAKSGKTKSALRLAKGIQQARGGDIWFIDTENRAHEYGDQFTFQRVPFKPPFAPQRFQAAVKYAFDNGGRIIVIDSMSDEHDGAGGLLDMHEAYLLDKVAKFNRTEVTESDRGSYGQTGWARVKPQRKRFENYLRNLRDFEDVVFVFCYRANLKYVPKTKEEKARIANGEVKKEEIDVQWEVSSTSDIPFIASVSLLLIPGEAGSPIIKPTTEAEKKLILRTDTYGPYLQTVKQLDESVGRKLYELAKGTGAKPAAARGGVRFNPSYASARGLIADSDPPTIDAYMCWLNERMEANDDAGKQRIAVHVKEVADIYSSMLRAEAS